MLPVWVGPGAVHTAWAMGGRIFDLAPDHLDRVTREVLAMVARPKVMLDAETALRESAGLRRLRAALDISDQVHADTAREAA